MFVTIWHFFPLNMVIHKLSWLEYWYRTNQVLIIPIYSHLILSQPLFSIVVEQFSLCYMHYVHHSCFSEYYYASSIILTYHVNSEEKWKPLSHRFWKPSLIIIVVKQKKYYFILSVVQCFRLCNHRKDRTVILATFGKHTQHPFHNTSLFFENHNKKGKILLCSMHTQNCSLWLNMLY